jgi:endoglucanase
MIKSILSLLLWCVFCRVDAQPALSWIRINQLGYPPAGVKAAVLLYNDWNNRNSLLVTSAQFRSDFHNNLAAMRSLGIDTTGLHYFIPPYEWWNDSVAAWARSIGWQIINFTPGIRTNADYTWPELGASYLGSDRILQSLRKFESSRGGGLNGAIILVHAGVDPRRKDRLYTRLDELIVWLQSRGYHCVRVNDLL